MAAVSSCTFVFTSHIQPHYLNRFVKKRFKSVNRVLCIILNVFQMHFLGPFASKGFVL